MRRSQKTGRWPSSWPPRTAEDGGCLMQRGRDTDREDRGGALHAPSDFAFVNDDVKRARAPQSNRSSSGSRQEAVREQGSIGGGGSVAVDESTRVTFLSKRRVGGEAIDLKAKTEGGNPRPPISDAGRHETDDRRGSCM
ncbi:hypothetical protein THAOC_00133 [Thalassiosira oceanica]|uniref:Uncharacterized protein n=1 Tax=Thalassiosira oceanica TaxID=159749 RepID=K3W4I4_THAOC|nr:hypothetical protein THAOC_00133 [Thalassiosira oceanica]|eukprot:EJK77994.1 hypothetical protein THAOC_00133 [Thalassiosira oceanica]